jgi:hypothetical protein
MDGLSGSFGAPQSLRARSAVFQSASRVSATSRWRVDCQVAAASQVGVVAGAFDVGGAQCVGFGGAVLEFGGHGERGLDGQRGERADEEPPDGLVQAGAGGMAVQIGRAFSMPSRWHR